MSIITITTPFNIDLEFKAAPFHRRMFAWFIDFVVLCAYNYVVCKFLIDPFDFSENTQFVLFLLFAAIPSYIYPLLMEQFLNGQSFGKRAIGLKVISMDGNEPTLGQYLLRWMLGLGNLVLFMLPYIVLYAPYMVIFAMIFYLPDVLAIAVTSKGTRLGDMAAHTVLIDSRRLTQLEDTIYLEIEDAQYQVVFPEVMKLTDRDINGIRNLLDVKKQNKDTYIYMAKIAERIKEVLNLQTSLDPESLMRQLLKDYNHLTRK
jgi:uncharacterized RDD family membrane protein YckC